MKTQQEIEMMKDRIQEKIDFAHRKAVSASQYGLSDHWYERKRQLMAQYNILVEILK